jgi:hypothetical protein
MFIAMSGLEAVAVSGLQQKQCSKRATCERTIYKNRLCKKHFLDKIEVTVRNLIRSLYRDPAGVSLIVGLILLERVGLLGH